MEDRRFVDVHNQFGAEQARNMSKSVLGKCGRPVPEFIAIQILVNDLSQGSNSLLAGLCDVVKSSLQIPPSLLLRFLGYRL